MAGSLIRLLAGDDDPTGIEISEMASVSPAHFEAQLNWYGNTLGSSAAT